MSALTPDKPLDPLPDISGKVVSITDLAIHRKHRAAFLEMIQQLLTFIREEENKLTPKENAERVAFAVVSELLDFEIPHSDLLGMELLRYTAAYLLFDESMNRDALIDVIKNA